MMKQILFSLILLSAPVYMLAQTDTWKMYHNKRLIFETGNSDEEKNKLRLQQADLQKQGYVQIEYKSSLPAKEWARTITVNDENDNQLLIKEKTNSLKLDHAQIKKLLKDHASLKIYTWAIPTDPNLAAAVRVRRIYLCTIELR